MLKTSEKLYYSIGEVAEELNLAASLIRYWESEFEQLNPKKNARGMRRFSREDIQLIQLIYTLTKEQGYTLTGAKQFIEQQHKNGTKEVILKLEKIKDELIALRNSI